MNKFLAWDRVDQLARIGALRIAEGLLYGSAINDTSAVQDRDGVGDLPDRSEIMGNEEIGQTEVALELVGTGEICACTVTSRADTASSSTRISGFGTKARAIATRWRCPPIMLEGRRCWTSRGKPTLRLSLPRVLPFRLWTKARSLKRLFNNTEDTLAGIEEIKRVAVNQLYLLAELSQGLPRRVARSRPSTITLPDVGF